jgi:LemA protein
MSPLTLTLLFLVAVFASILIALAVITYNTFQRIRINVTKSRQNIAVLLKQRFDELPRLVEICKDIFEKESDLLARLTLLRTQFDSAGNGDELKVIQRVSELNAALSDLTRNLSAVSESYPAIRTSEHYLFLMSRLSALEEQIADRREYYNESVSLYNARLVSIPDIVIAKGLGYEPEDFIRVPESEQKIPALNLK